MTKKAFKIIEGISLFAILVLAFIGVIFVGTIVHELSHWNDYKEIVQDDYICLLNMPANGSQSVLDIHGAYYYTYNTTIPNWQEKAGSLDRITELKAYGLEIALIGVLFFISTTIIFIGRAKNNKNSEPSSNENIKLWQEFIKENKLNEAPAITQIGKREKFFVGRNVLYEDSLRERFSARL